MGKRTRAPLETVSGLLCRFDPIGLVPFGGPASDSDPESRGDPGAVAELPLSRRRGRPSTRSSPAGSGPAALGNAEGTGRSVWRSGWTRHSTSEAPWGCVTASPTLLTDPHHEPRRRTCAARKHCRRYPRIPRSQEERPHGLRANGPTAAATHDRERARAGSQARCCTGRSPSNHPSNGAVGMAPVVGVERRGGCSACR